MKETCIIPAHQLMLIAGGQIPPTPSSTYPMAKLPIDSKKIGNANITPDIFVGAPGVVAKLQVDYPLTKNLNVYANGSVGTNYHSAPKVQSLETGFFYTF